MTGLTFLAKQRWFGDRLQDLQKRWRPLWACARRFRAATPADAEESGYLWVVAFLKVETASLFPRVRTGLLQLLEDLDESEWEKPTICEGWDVKDVSLHLLGVEIGNISRGRDGVTLGPPTGTRLIDWLNGFNQEWVLATRRMSPRLLRELLNLAGEMFESHLKTLDPDAMTARVSWASDGPVPVWLDIAREFTERWVHQQQIRDATGRMDLRGPEFIAPVLQTFIHALPKTYKDIDAREGSVVQLEVEGPGGGTWHMIRSETGWELQLGEHSEPDSLVTMDSDSAWRLFTRDPHAGTPTIKGDNVLGGHVMQAVAIIA